MKRTPIKRAAPVKKAAKKVAAKKAVAKSRAPSGCAEGRHPKASEEFLGYMVRCRRCGGRVR